MRKKPLFCLRCRLEVPNPVDTIYCPRCLSLNRDAIMDLTFKCDFCDNWLAVDTFLGFVDSKGVVMAHFIQKYIKYPVSEYTCSECLKAGRGRITPDPLPPADWTLTIVGGDGKPLNTPPSNPPASTDRTNPPAKIKGSPPPTSKPAAQNFQRNLSPGQNLDWNYGVTGGKGNMFALNPATDHFKFSKPITTLVSGQFCTFHFYISENPVPGKFNNALEICGGGKDAWVLNFDRQKQLVGDSLRLNNGYEDQFGTSGLIFHPDAWNRVDLSLDGKTLSCKLNGINLKMNLVYGSEGAVDIMVRAIGLSVTIAGLNV